MEAINAEEEAYGWDQSVYPQRIAIIGMLKPYLLLYETSVEFLNKTKYDVTVWRHSMM